jgi:hypothetical protein
MPTTSTSAASSAPAEVMTMPGRGGTRNSPRLAEAELHAVRAMQVGEDRAELGTDLGVQRGRLRLEHGDLAAAVRAAAVVSRPIQPAPATTTRGAGWKAARSRSESASVRRYSTSSDRSRGRSAGAGDAPVASSSLS